MKKRKGTFAGLLALGGLLLILAGYLALCFYYSRVFSYGTWINGIYCTGKSVDEVNAELLAATALTDITITDKDNIRSVLHGEEIGYTIDYQSQLQRCFKLQNPFLWIIDLAGQKEYTVTPEISFDEEALLVCIGRTQAVIRAGLRPQKVEIFRDENGYGLYNGMEQVLNVSKLSETVKEELYKGNTDISLSESDCYENLPLTAAMQDTIELYRKIEAFQTCEITYDMGDRQIPVSSAITWQWIALTEEGDFLLDENRSPVLSEEGIKQFIDTLCEEYDTYGSCRTFQATRGEEVLIEGGTYGSQIDRSAEAEYLKQAFLEGKSETRIPKYTRETQVRGKDDIGDTYIEIDMTEQKMYYYLEGEQVLATDIVTGNMRRKWGTPSGVNFVYNKQKNRILRGEGYASPVKFWMPVKGNIGIHDASWRSEFGGEIYMKNGSHGCINTPTEIMTKLYDMVEIGTPVVMFY